MTEFFLFFFLLDSTLGSDVKIEKHFPVAKWRSTLLFPFHSFTIDINVACKQIYV